ncbi:MAG: hypothetical protein JSW60_07205 [Thermoplasmatales archaeon]|nr:MAG: hypothetical protein JSW60_07205 [Thermoplasmatales archaeon]
MKNTGNVKLTMIIAVICITLVVSPVTGLHANELIKKENKTENQTTTYGQEGTGTEYWALIFAVGIYKNNPSKDRPEMIEAANDLKDVLLDSPQWQEDHIHKVTGVEATGRRLIKELIWLIRNEDADDMSLIYLTTHGSPLIGPRGYPVDIPPRDENDGADEILMMYEGFDKWYAFIWDDLLNFFLSLLQSKGVCLIVDSCYSGGYNDGPMFKGVMPNQYTAESFTQGFMEELGTQSRVVLMSCRENEVSYGNDFSGLLIGGFVGLADLFGNGDGINSAEESFYFAEFWLELVGQQHPTILDLYDGEFPVTYN